MDYNFRPRKKNEKLLDGLFDLTNNVFVSFDDSDIRRSLSNMGYDPIMQHWLFDVVKNNGTTSVPRINGDVQTVTALLGSNQGNVPNDANTVFNSCNMGRQLIYGNTYYRTNICGDVLVYDRALTDAECEQVENYLMAKHSIT